jgi:type IV pilus assembly protein PilC
MLNFFIKKNNKTESKSKKNEIKNPFRNFGLNNDIDYFIENLSMLIASGMPIVGALDSIIEEVRTKRMKEVLEEIKGSIEGGSPIWEAFLKSGLFKGHTISLVRIGEESGKLIENLKVVSVEGQKTRILKSKIHSATMYPVFVLSITLIIGIGIAWFILPKLALVFAQLKLKLPFITKMLIDTGVFLDKHGHYVVPSLILFLIIFFYFIFFFKKTKIAGQYILFHIPGIKQLMKEVEISRFGYLLGTLLQAGMPVNLALESLSNATDFILYRKFYVHMSKSIEEGYSFQKSFILYKKTNKLIPSPILQLIVAGEKSGNLSSSLIKIGEMFEEKSDTTAKNLTTMLEPILLVLVWLGVVAVALAVILPIYGLVGSLNGPR